MIEGSRMKFAKGIQKIDFSPEEERESFFIIREFDTNLNINCRYINAPEINICFYDNQFCFLINGLNGNLTLDLSKFLAKKNLKIVPCNSLSKIKKEFIDCNETVEVLTVNEKLKQEGNKCIIIKDFTNYLNISCKDSILSPDINIILHNNNQLIISLGSMFANFTIDVSGFLANNNLKIVSMHDNIKVPEITDAG